MKKIFTIGAVVLLLSALCSCNTNVETPDPTSEAIIPTETQTTAPAPITPSVTTPELTYTPTNTYIPFGTEVPYDAEFYGTPFEVWPLTDNGTWSPRAFLQFNIVFNEKERKLIEKQKKKRR